MFRPIKSSALSSNDFDGFALAWPASSGLAVVLVVVVAAATTVVFAGVELAVAGGAVGGVPAGVAEAAPLPLLPPLFGCSLVVRITVAGRPVAAVVVGLVGAVTAGDELATLAMVAGTTFCPDSFAMGGDDLANGAKSIMGAFCGASSSRITSATDVRRMGVEVVGGNDDGKVIVCGVCAGCVELKLGELVRVVALLVVLLGALDVVVCSSVFWSAILVAEILSGPGKIMSSLTKKGSLSRSPKKPFRSGSFGRMSGLSWAPILVLAAGAGELAAGSPVLACMVDVADESGTLGAFVVSGSCVGKAGTGVVVGPLVGTSAFDVESEGESDGWKRG
jgi:hypothetical protein